MELVAAAERNGRASAAARRAPKRGTAVGMGTGPVMGAVAICVATVRVERHVGAAFAGMTFFVARGDTPAGSRPPRAGERRERG